uniref:Uncharacterized protein n=1 Tax=uncultured Spirochaetaceae bacterium TaxID=201186 RepID=A0A650ENN4_9SPIO|nr:hypothetical protein Unknown280_0910 [uncultured Spirochaetaceae bacterium]
MLDKGANVNAKVDKYGYTTLILAAQKGYLDVAKLLIDKGTCINAKDEFGKTAEMWAIQKKHTDVSDLIRKTNEEREEQIRLEQESKGKGDGRTSQENRRFA